MSAAAVTSKFRAPLLAIFSGSNRIGSVNTKLAKAADAIAQQQGASTTVVDLAEYKLPLYDPNLEESEGMPESAIDLKTALKKADGWIVASPEYNGHVSPLLLNAMTWCSRGDSKDEGMYATFRDKIAICISASPGAMGGMRSLAVNQRYLQNLGVNVLPQSVAIGGAFQAFSEEGNLTDSRQQQMLTQAVQSLFLTTRDTANRDATCDMISHYEQQHMVGEYGSVSVANQ